MMSDILLQKMKVVKILRLWEGNFIPVAEKLQLSVFVNRCFEYRGQSDSQWMIGENCKC